MSLANKYRPRKFEDVTEQDFIIKILKNQLKEKNVHSLYLFIGPAGTGKTTNARIFANELNETEGAYVEVDAASNNSVDNVRDIIKDAHLKPVGVPYKVYIIDEAHLLSASAVGAFLKLLEEPPQNVVFIFCTTDPQKFPATIFSRGQRFDFQKISFGAVCKRLEYIVLQEKITLVDPAAIEFIAKLADGGMRDAVTLLDTCLGYSKELTIPNVTESLNVSGYKDLFESLYYLVEKNKKDAIEHLEKIYMSGKDLKLFFKQLLELVMDIMKYQFYTDFKYIKVSNQYKKDLDFYIEKDINKELVAINSLCTKLKYEQNPKLAAEVDIILMCTEV